ncbi:hypothetical protein, partial [Methylocaldum szegediense]|uniref:hypothetical protein n=1 Tax=Methylocaldum szegediense TaxID=73780 RepID=UPI001F3BDBD2
LALFDTLSIDGESGRLEYFDEGCELRLGHSNQRCHDAVIGYLAKFVVDHGRFLYLDLFKKQLGHQYHALASGTTLLELGITSLLFKHLSFASVCKCSCDRDGHEVLPLFQGLPPSGMSKAL